MFSPYGATKHYGVAIQKELERRGAIVKGYDERPSQNSLTKIVIRLFKKKVPQIFDKYISKIVVENRGENFDYILICRGEAFTPLTIEHLRHSFPKSKIILYLWDILKSTDVSYNIPYVDKAMSFDPEDAKNHVGLIFRPTFYVEEYLSVNDSTPKENDIVFIGTLHSNRHNIIKQIEKDLSFKGFSFFKYLYVPSFFVYIKDYLTKFPYISIKEINFSPISISETIALLNKTKAILDINYTSQKSLSTRAYEAMAAKRKYITTNAEVMHYDFYNPNNIAVVDIENINLSHGFLNSPFNEIPAKTLYYYSVAGLVDDLFDGI